MKKIFIITTVILLSACGGSSEEVYVWPDSEITSVSEWPEKVLVSGQSNAVQCDWTYFEDATGSEVVNIAVGGKTIESLIDIFYSEQPISEVYSTMIFVHGEADARVGTDLDEYISGIDEYQNALGVDSIIFSLVGLRTITSYDEAHYALRNRVEAEAMSRDSWHIGYYNAYSFRDRDMLKDTVHFSTEGCQEMMNSIINKAPY